MKRFAFLAVSALLLLLTAGCTAPGDSGAASDLTFGTPPWKDGDKASYDWLDKSGNKVGSSELAYAMEGSAWLLSSADKFSTLDQSSKVRVNGQTLRPVGGEKSIKAQDTDAAVTYTYSEKGLEIKAKVNGEDKSASTDFPANALDNDQLLMTLRALPFADKYAGKTTVVNAQNATKVPATVRVIGKETVTVPAGSFEAWKVELDFGQAKQTAWYGTDAGRNLVQYDNGQIKLALAK